MIIKTKQNNDVKAVHNKQACSIVQRTYRLPPTEEASPPDINLPKRERAIQGVRRATFSLTLGLLCNMLAVDAAWAIGDTVLDGSVMANGSKQNFGSGSFTVPQTAGATSGTNLFHSFQFFNINPGQTVTFTGDSSLQNVISRVTGGSSSDIQGTLISNVGNANFYLINPAGVIFGPDASVNVPAAFHVSTADKLKFQNGELTVSDLNANTLSLTTTPLTFSFSATNAYNNGLIAINGSKSQTDSAGKPISFTGNANNLDIVSGKIDIENTKDQQVNITQSGAIRLVAMQGAGSVGVDSSTLTDASGQALGKPSASSGGDITINDATANINGDPNGAIKTTAAGGSIKLWGGKINVSGFDIASTSGNGNVKVQANTLTLDNHGTISADTTSKTQTNDTTNVGVGNVTVEATDTLNVLNGSSITSDIGTSGKGGNVTVSANVIKIDGQGKGDFTTKISADANQASPTYGVAGNVTVTAGSSLEILNGGRISSKSAIGGGGSGIIKIIANQWIHMTDGIITIDTSSKKLNPTNVLAPPGYITVTAPDIVLKNSSVISNGTGDIPAGNIEINASHSLTMDPSWIATNSSSGDGGKIDIKGGQLIYLQGSGFTTNATGSNNNAGNITATADALVMDNGFIAANANKGSGGSIQLNIGTTIPSGNLLHQGEATPIDYDFSNPSNFYTLGYNLIQAASASGITGRINLTSPQLNLSSAIANIGAPTFREADLSQDYCDIGSGSTLPTKERRGGLQPKASDLQIQSAWGPECMQAQ